MACARAAAHQDPAAAGIDDLLLLCPGARG